MKVLRAIARAALGAGLGLAAVGLYSLVVGCSCVNDPFVAVPVGMVTGAIAFWRVGEY